MSVARSESLTSGGVSAQDSGFIIVPLSPEADRMPILMRYARGVDLVRKPIDGSVDKGTLAGREYEHECFANRVRLIPPDQYALGPGIVDEAFSML
ncbi:MAG: hypothetical protein ACD_37C00049G0003 [uncultured bacterium]|nr:MAG: hypothetical protein ACD_37C00049G0003 [uncultured bacterium]KKR17583.1 MAG: hypothetical protein UT44_C0006G0010 [Candidatus Levybacteria bacterium GW2011_GWA1_39_32]KKR51480.1 MAG: hypothetical protein UT87_C0005G0016 [Candidatus Levybacteria bacterium GW2011_GWC1_40_19]KKR73568.1 MAG: hypothetical protein UU15_C0007G0014 [Candidatus Levybacteria bacterium GW2011_GWC2_40_7]KKR95455.1 MAG: hypothetical protein UU45_C0001G0050 [Candidatus Levybacteria bacterium GW2011_GWA2_41_15]KKS019